jgi:hypothetical protein
MEYMIFNKNWYYAEYQGSIKREGISEANKENLRFPLKGRGRRGNRRFSYFFGITNI